MDSGSPDEKAKAVQLLDKVLTRLMIETKQDEGNAKDIFEVGFTQEIVTKLIAKVQDMYCCTVSCEILNKCFVTGTQKT